LQAGAVVGPVFWTSSVVHLLDGEEPDFDLLEERDFIRSRRASTIAGEREYAIKHALTREVAYGSIPKARRGRWHASLADWLERSELRGDERAALLAYHYSEAAKPEDVDLVWADDTDELERLRARAVYRLRRAGVLARGRYEIDEALELFTRAADLCGDAHECALAWREVGEVQALRYDGEGMRQALLRAVEGPLDDAERADAYAFLAFQSSIRSAMWSIRLNMDLIEEWAGKALELAADGTEAQARALLARANIEPVGASGDVLVEATALAEALDSLELRSFALGAKTQAAFDQRRFREAASWSEQRLALLPGIDDPDHRCEAYESGSPAPLRSVGSMRHDVCPTSTPASRSGCRRTIVSTPSRSSSSWRRPSATGPVSQPRPSAHLRPSRQTSRRRVCGIRGTCSSAVSPISRWATSPARPSSRATGCVWPGRVTTRT